MRLCGWPWWGSTFWILYFIYIGIFTDFDQHYCTNNYHICMYVCSIVTKTGHSSPTVFQLCSEMTLFNYSLHKLNTSLFWIKIHPSKLHSHLQKFTSYHKTPRKNNFNIASKITEKKIKALTEKNEQFRKKLTLLTGPASKMRSALLAGPRWHSLCKYSTLQRGESGGWSDFFRLMHNNFG